MDDVIDNKYKQWKDESLRGRRILVTGLDVSVNLN